MTDYPRKQLTFAQCPIQMLNEEEIRQILKEITTMLNM